MDIITSTSNKLVKELNRLNKDVKERRRRDVFIVEGIRMFKEIPLDKVMEIYMSESAYHAYKDDEQVVRLMEAAPAIVLSDSVFMGVSQTKTPQGCMAIVKCMHYEFDFKSDNDDSETYLVLDTLQDPGNMGTILRSAEAAGITAVIIGPGCCDPYNPKVVRATMGAIFRVPFIQSDNLIETIEVMKDHGIVIYGAHLMGDNLYEASLHNKSAFLIGNEGNGLSKEVAATSDKLLRIPMEGKVESLNAAISATLLSYEAMRQRSFGRQN